MKANECTNPWHDDELARLRELVAQNVGNVEIAKALGRSVLSVKSKINRMGFPARIKPQKSWPPEETAQLLRLRDEVRLGWSEIALRLNRPSGTCYSKYVYVKNAAPRNKTERAAPVDPENYREWRRRQLLSPVTLTAAIFGDPLPGYSALDKRAP